MWCLAASLWQQASPGDSTTRVRAIPCAASWKDKNIRPRPVRASDRRPIPKLADWLPLRFLPDPYPRADSHAPVPGEPVRHGLRVPDWHGEQHDRGDDHHHSTSVAMSRLSSETLKTLCGQVKEPLGEQIHIAWYCVMVGSNRFEDTEEEFIRALHWLGIPDAGRADAGSAQG